MKIEDNMNFNISDNLLKKIFLGLLIIILFIFSLNNIAIIINFLKYILNLMMPFLVGCCIAFIINIPVRYIEKVLINKIKKQKLKRAISILMSFLLVFLIIAIFLILIVPQIFKSFSTLEEKLPVFIESIIIYLKKIPFLTSYAIEFENKVNSLSWNLIFENISSFLLKDNVKTFSTAVNTATAIINYTVSIFLSLVFAIYLLADKEKFERGFRKLIKATFKEKISSKIEDFFKLINYYYYSFIKKQLTDALILGTLSFIGMNMFKLPYSLMLSILIAFLDLIPIIGPVIAVCIGYIIILIEFPNAALVYLILMIIIQQIEGNIIYPKLVGHAFRTPSIWILFWVTVGSYTWGIIGIWIIVPFSAAIYNILYKFINKKNNNLVEN